MRQITVTEHLLLHQTKSPAATGQFTALLNDLILSAKIIAKNANKAGLLDILGVTGQINVQGEQIQKMDDFANNVLIHRMERAGVLCAMSSEEEADVIQIPEMFQRGEYVLIFDPLDGSSNMDVNVDVGTIFSIYRCKEKLQGTVKPEDFLQCGAKQVAAGYFLYGPSTMMVYSTGLGVHGFTLDPSVGEFLLSHPNIRIPEQGTIYSVNECAWHYWDDATKEIVSYFKGLDNTLGRPYNARYVGALVADFHRNMLNGGIYMYPKDCRSAKKPNGKLRLLCEAAPLAFLAEQAGGRASTGVQNILELEPKTLHDRTPLFIGSKIDVDMAESIYRKYA